ncbi:MAG TPA: hypothetical protein DEG06_00715 [Lachnospiraceae bacterium]|jgi:Mor family transcriptional regulator|nr:hypothetical protein [Lachnospiraceae bacterium]HBY70738.1 hypothetical protein [Lachnospiraceae bacterium]HCA70700.1 hypothetical protein [Lachnospiraceae bacterium]HCM13940.1 hypothetical protein [Lachnospiraceae bacterium]HCR40202.1 hypothetical protein [Lachnospiraceae bacterium]
MSYKKASHVLPLELVELIQDYVDGEYIYIPKKDRNRKAWGSNTTIREELETRNSSIYANYLNGMSTDSLADRYYLSIKSIQRIVLNKKRESYL